MVGNPDVLSSVQFPAESFITKRAEVLDSRSIILNALSMGIAMHAVASASAVIADGAIIVALRISEFMGMPVVGLMVWPMCRLSIMR